MFKELVIFDLDGTMRNNSHRLHHIQQDPKDWDSFFKDSVYDKPIEKIVDLHNYFLKKSDYYQPVIVTGHGEEYKKELDEWFLINKIPYYKLYQRKLGDRREDSVVKLEILFELLQNNKIAFALDDRPSVVKAFRANNIQTLQVGFE